MKMTRHVMSVLCILSAAACSSGPAPHVASTSAPHATSDRLALVTNGHLSVVDSATSATTDLSALGPADHPAWSSSGQWLSYASNGQLWVSRADGAHAHLVAPSASGSAWSPASDRLAVPASNGVLVVAAAGGSTTIAPGCLVSSLAWSPDGRQLAAVCDAPGHVDRVITTSADGGTGGASTTSAKALTVPKLIADGDTGLRLAGWWPDGLGLLVWVDPQHSASLAADGMSLVSVGLDAGAGAHPLATTLGYPSWLSWSPDGHRLVVAAGSDRRTWTGKRLTVCDAHRGDCLPLVLPQGKVAVDPAWSPDGARIVYVQADDQPGTGGETAAWTASRQLWTVKPDGSDATRVASDLTGASEPRWNSAGALISVVAADRVLVLDPSSGATTPVGGLLSAADVDYYGTADWSALLAWR